MIRHAWTVICQKSIIDRETNNISLDVLEQLSIHTPPLPTESKGIIFPTKFEIVSLWYRQPTEAGLLGKGRIKIIAPKNQEVGSATIDINLNDSHRSRTRVRLDGLPIPKDSSGYFYFVTEIDQEDAWIEVSRIPLEINIQHLAD